MIDQFEEFLILNTADQRAPFTALLQDAQGLVRKLGGDEPTWEISHDFLARAIGRLIGRLKPTLFRRIQPVVAPVALALWIAFLGLFLPDWLQRNDEQRVMKFVSLSHDDGTYVATANDHCSWC